MKKLLFLLIVVSALLAALLFSSPGRQNLLVPAANLYLQYAVPEHRIVLERLEPGVDSLRLAGKVDGSIRFEAEGPVEWFRRRFDLRYDIRGNEVRIGKRSYPLQLDLKGSLKGTPGSMHVTGRGTAFEAQTRYRFTLQGERIGGVEIRARGARVDQLLVLAGRTPLATGALDLEVEMPRLTGATPEGKAHVMVHDGRIDRRLLKREFDVDLPPVERYRLEGFFRLQKGLVRGEARLSSPLLNLSLKRFRSDTEFRIFKSAYTLEIPELSRLKPLTKRELFGPWKSDGQFYYNRSKGTLQVEGKSPSLEGETRFFYDSGRLDLTLVNVGLPPLLALTGQPPLIRQGRLNGKAALKLGKSLSGSFDYDASGEWDPREVAGLTGEYPGESLGFRLTGKGEIAKGILAMRSEYRNPLFDLKIGELRYALKDGAMEGRYGLKVPDLGRLKFFAKRGGHAPLDLRGTLSYLPVKKLLKIEGSSASFGGESRFLYAGRRFNLSMKNAEGARVLGLLGVKPVLEASRLDASLKISDLEKRIGNFTLSLSGTLDRQKVKKLYGIDPGPKVRTTLKGRGELRGERLDAAWTLESSLGRLQIERCRVDLRSGVCTGAYRLRIPELERLRFLTGRKYRGPLNLAGTLRWDGTLRVDGGGREWGGRIEYLLEGDLLRVRTSQLDAKALLKMLGYAPMIEGELQSDLRYNLQSEEGTLEARMKEGRLLSGPLTQVASKMLRYDLSKERFREVRFDSVIKGPEMVFNFRARSARLDLSVRKGKFDRKRGRIDALVTILSRNKRYRLQVRGPLDRPSVIPLLTDDLARKVEKEIKKHKIGKKIDKAIPKELKKEGSPVSDFFKKLF